ncbi:ribonuclease YeeF family protein [Bacillus licheniformis]|uniref:ribonuclease YeeF family protein n=1 Tax=Bacillus licheniformis TaxID=1402 RepID=UPI0025A2D102|nr:LXG domain-containing protein [Bacillus licheniformis]MDM5289216.1 LXG domain-containing protein [Bacillus licheniformis]MED1523441.1 LXG domain-containing protein [Bacillus licheniformis]MED4930801.1 LXG domain-containing protein [Bacillus licheniformis]
MKTLDVQALHKAIDQTLEQLKQQSDEFAQVQKAVEEIASLNDALKGKGGDAIRAFYKECHTPFLQFYDTFIEEYSSALKKMKSALNSLEPNHNGFISQSFLEHQLENGLNAADRTTKHLVSKTNATIAKVSHIVDLPDLNDSDFHEQNRKALKEINQTIEKLHTFDREQTSALKTAENDLETMQRYITRLEKMYTGPKIEITGYQKGSILKPDEMDTLRGGQDTAMGVMLDKLDKRSKLEKEVSEVSKQDNKISKLKKKLDDYNFSTASEFYEMATEIGYENLSPWQQRYFNQIEGVRDFGNAIKGSAEGLKNAVVDTAVGLWDMVVHADETIEGINFTLHHPDVTFNIIKKGIEDSYQRDVVNGDSYTQARWFSYAVGMVGTSIVGSKGVDKAAKAAKAGKVGQVAAKATKASKKVSKQALEKSVASFKKSMQRVASNIKGIQIHNPFAPQIQLAGGGKVPYHVIDGENFKKTVIQRIEKVFNVQRGVKNSRKIDYDLAKDYIRDVETKTGLKIHKKQTEQLKNALRNHKFEKMTPKETMKHRNKFNNVKDKLISEWEEKTGQKWPRYKEQVFDKKGRVARDIGQPYDAHHIIENNFGGPHEWWNIHPAKFPDEHQAGIHGKGAPSNKLFPRR